MAAEARGRPVATGIGIALGMLLVAPGLGGAKARESQRPELRVMTYNIRLDTPADGDHSWSHRRGWVVAQLQWLRPQVFGMQEVVPGQKSDLAQDLPDYQIIGGGRDDGHERGEASPIGFDRRQLRLLDSGMFWLSPTPAVPSMGWDAAYPRIATWARLELRAGKRSLLVLNTHWDNLGREARRQSALQMAAWLKAQSRRCEPVVLLGDFNSDLQDEPLRILASDSPLREARALAGAQAFGPAGTFNDFQAQPSTAPRIDYVFVGTGIDVQRYTVFAQHIDGHVPSDHFPVLADLALEPCARTRLSSGASDR